MDDHIKRDYTLRLMWNALYALEDKQEADHGLNLIERKATQDGFEAGQQAVVNAPAADAVEVVRCKDCAHSYEDIIYINGVATCGRCCSCGPCCDSPVDDDFFCRYGEPKSGTGEDENER